MAFPMKKISIIILFALPLFLIIAGCASSLQNPLNGNPEKIQVAVDIYPYEFLVKQIGGDKVDVIRLFPDGVEPHTYEPSMSDVVRIQNSRIMVYNGIPLNALESKIVSDLNAKTTVISASEGIELLKGHVDGNLAEPAGASPTRGDLSSDISYDPHIWLDPLNMIKVSRQIESVLANASPSDAEYFHANTQNLISRLEKLDSDLQAKAGSFRSKEYVGFHPAFNYFNRRYGLKYAANIEEIAGIEPTAQEMAGILETVKAHKISAIYAEPLFDSRSADAISRESGTKVLFLNPMHTLTSQDLGASMDYFGIMEQNMDSLAKTLK